MEKHSQSPQNSTASTESHTSSILTPKRIPQIQTLYSNENVINNYWSVTAEDRNRIISDAALCSAHCKINDNHSTGESNASSRTNSVSVHRRVKKFLIENILPKRIRTTSTNIPNSSIGSFSPIRRESENKTLPPVYKHAHTITANNEDGKLILKEINTINSLALEKIQKRNIHDNLLKREASSRRPLPLLENVLISKSSGMTFDKKNRLTSSFNESILPDPSKLPKAHVSASLEFSHTSLRKSETRRSKFSVNNILSKDRAKKERKKNLSNLANNKTNQEETKSRDAAKVGFVSKMIVQHQADGSLFNALTLDTMIPVCHKDFSNLYNYPTNLEECKYKCLSASYSTGFCTKENFLLSDKPSFVNSPLDARILSRQHGRPLSIATCQPLSLQNSIEIPAGMKNRRYIPNSGQNGNYQQNQGQSSPSHHHPHHHHHHHGHGQNLPHHRHHHHRHGHHNHHKKGSRYTHILENDRFLLFKSAKPFRSPNEYMVTRGKGLTENETYSVLFQHTSCYELLPQSARLVAIDSELSIGKALRALISNGIRCAPVWNSTLQTFSTMLTVSDFVQMLNTCMNFSENTYIDENGNPGSRLDIEDLEKMTVRRWKSIRKGQKLANKTELEPDCLKGKPVSSVPDQLTFIEPEESIFKALRKLFRMRIHRLPVIDSPNTATGNPLFVMNHHCLLDFLHSMQKNLPQPYFLSLSLEETGLHIQKEIAVITLDHCLSETIKLFEDLQISAIPVVNNLQEKKLLTIFAKFDVVILALNGSHKNPNLKISEGIEIRNQILQANQSLVNQTQNSTKDDKLKRQKVEICLPSDTVQEVLDKLIKTGVHRLVVIDSVENERVVGIISISDLLYFMVLKQARRFAFSSSHTTAVPEEMHSHLSSSTSSSILDESECSEECSEDEGNSNSSTRSSFSSSAFSTLPNLKLNSYVDENNEREERKLFQVETLTNILEREPKPETDAC